MTLECKYKGKLYLRTYIIVHVTHKGDHIKWINKSICA